MARTTAKWAFTLIEILIVVVILGILAAIVIIGVSSVSKEAREAVLRDELHFMRTQLAVYRAVHANPAGIDSSGQLGDSTLFVSQLTQCTDYAGNVSDSVPRDGLYAYGPYFSQNPVNPISSKSSVKLVPSGASLAGPFPDTFGWVYKPDTLEFCANSTEYGPAGRNW